MQTSYRVERSSPKWLAIVAAACVSGIALGSFALSFSALSDLAARSGIPANIAWVWPTIIDGSIVTAMLVIFQWRNAPRREVAWPWVTLGLFALVSIIGNAVHTVTVVDETNGVAVPFAVFVGSMPPIALLLSSEMLVRLLTGRGSTPRSVVMTDSAPDTVSSPVSRGDTQDDIPRVTVSSPAIERESATPIEALPEDVSLERDTDDTEMTAEEGAVMTPDVEADTSDTHEEPVTAEPETPGDRPQPWTPEVIDGHGVPDSADGQVAWLVEQLRAGKAYSKEDLAELFEVSERTAARRLSAARKVVPDVSSSAAAEQAVKEG